MGSELNQLDYLTHIGIFNWQQLAQGDPQKSITFTHAIEGSSSKYFWEVIGIITHMLSTQIVFTVRS